MPQPDSSIADLAPSEPQLTPYDQRHAVTYIRLLDAEADNADWREVARIVLQIDPALEPDRARRAFESHPCAYWGEKSKCQVLIGDQRALIETAEKQTRSILPGSGSGAIASTKGIIKPWSARNDRAR